MAEFLTFLTVAAVTLAAIVIGSIALKLFIDGPLKIEWINTPAQIDKLVIKRNIDDTTSAYALWGIFSSPVCGWYSVSKLMGCSMNQDCDASTWLVIFNDNKDDTAIALPPFNGLSKTDIKLGMLKILERKIAIIARLQEKADEFNKS